jgi:hypothetical protein
MNFFAHRLALIEELEDGTYRLACINLLGLLEDYRRFDCHVVATKGKSKILKPSGAIASRLRE